MKKYFAMLLAVAMVFGLCTFAAPVEAAAANEIKAGFIFLHDENSTYDLNFINAAKEACEELGVEYITKVNIPESEECLDAALELVDEGCNFIFADSFGHEPYMIQAARECPEVEFCHATGTQAHTIGLANYHNAFASIYEGRFLGGVAAGMKLNEMIEAGTITAEQAKVGYIGAFPYAEVISGMTSFYLGVRYICPSATMDVTFTNSWYDPTLEQEGAVKLINNDCVLISLHADSMGAPTECQNNGVPFVFYNGSAADACPDTYIVASYINWAPYLKYAMTCTMNGEAIDADWTGTLENGGVALKELNEAVAAEGTAAKIEEVKAALMDGSLKVFDTATFTVNGEALTTYLADVDDMGDFVPETEAVADGYFHESEYRSAPYFDMFIDGVTNLDA
ncbi:MAG: BMP family ABC transporter substrate-binding protein [Muribaculaceae bacterium]|nr:BMP family ABC transporter substrate-binding protein [Muribaculaceae bacterium]